MLLGGHVNKTLVSLTRLERTLNEEREASSQMELNLNCDIADLKVNFLFHRKLCRHVSDWVKKLNETLTDTEQTWRSTSHMSRPTFIFYRIIFRKMATK